MLQRTMVLTASGDSFSLSVTDINWNFSVMRSPIELKLARDLGLFGIPVSPE
jgi:hypothetical protein